MDISFNGMQSSQLKPSQVSDLCINDEQSKELTRQIEAREVFTKRPTSRAAEELLYQPFQVHKYGLVRLVDYQGTDATVVQAARVSYGQGTKKVSEDQALINYLLRRDHTTPFEMCSATYHIACPVFVARQIVRHRTAKINEYSGRYSVMPSRFFLPNLEDMLTQSTQNHQGRSDTHIDSQVSEAYQDMMSIVTDMSDSLYRFMINEIESEEMQHEVYKLVNSNMPAKYCGEEPCPRQDLSRELARTILPLNVYTEFYWKNDVHNLMHFLRLRADGHAQKEIRDYANVMCHIFYQWMPMTYKAFDQYRLRAAKLGADALSVVVELLQQGYTPELFEELTAQHQIGKREAEELKQLLCL